MEIFRSVMVNFWVVWHIKIYVKNLSRHEYLITWKSWYKVKRYQVNNENSFLVQNSNWVLYYLMELLETSESIIRIYLDCVRKWFTVIKFWKVFIAWVTGSIFLRINFIWTWPWNVGDHFPGYAGGMRMATWVKGTIRSMYKQSKKVI